MIELTAELSTSEDLTATLSEDVEQDAELGEITVAGVSSWNGQTGPVTYTAPVTSVNGQTGAVTLSIPTVPTDVSAFNNDAGYLTEHQSLDGYATQTWVQQQGYLTEHQSLSGYATEAWVGQQGYLTSAPVSSVNGQTGAVSLTIPTKTSDLTNNSDFTTKTYVDGIVGNLEALLATI